MKGMEWSGASLRQEHLLQGAITPSLQAQWIKQTEKMKKAAETDKTQSGQKDSH